jgi:hypothetical protein
MRSLPHILLSTPFDDCIMRSFADHEPALWKAVITQALMDAASNSAKSEAKKHRREALEWLLGESSDFESVCDHAGLDPAYVRRRAREALARNCAWRLPAGHGWRVQKRLHAHIANITH